MLNRTSINLVVDNEFWRFAVVWLIAGAAQGRASGPELRYFLNYASGQGVREVICLTRLHRDDVTAWPLVPGCRTWCHHPPVKSLERADTAAPPPYFSLTSGDYSKPLILHHTKNSFANPYDTTAIHLVGGVASHGVTPLLGGGAVISVGCFPPVAGIVECHLSGTGEFTCEVEYWECDMERGAVNIC